MLPTWLGFLLIWSTSLVDYKHLDQYRKRQIEVGHVVKEANQCVGHLASKGTVDVGAPR